MNKTPKIVEQVVSKDETVVVQQVVEPMMKEQEPTGAAWQLLVQRLLHKTNLVAKATANLFAKTKKLKKAKAPKAEAKGASQKKEDNPQQYKRTFAEVATANEVQQRNKDPKPAEKPRRDAKTQKETSGGQEVEQGMGKEETVVGQKVVEQVMKKEEALMSDSYKYLKNDKDGTVECPT